MSNNTLLTKSWSCVESQPGDIRQLREEERNLLIVSAIPVEENWVILSRYGDDHWQFTGQPTNRSDGHSYLNFNRVPSKTIGRWLLR